MSREHLEHFLEFGRRVVAAFIDSLFVTTKGKVFESSDGLVVHCRARVENIGGSSKAALVYFVRGRK